MESCLGFKGLDQESWKSLHPDGVQQDSLVVYNGCYLERSLDGVLMESRWTPDPVPGVYLDS